MNNIRNERAITLIALIITIIILLILSGVTIILLTGENGIMNKAIIASEATKKANAKERLQTYLIDIQAEKISEGKKVSLECLDEKSQELSEKGVKVENLGSPRNVTLEGYTFKVKDDLTIEGDGIQSDSNTGNSQEESGSTSGGGTQITQDRVEIDFYGEKLPSVYSGRRWNRK